VLIGAVLIFMSIPRRHLVAQVTLNKAVLGKFFKKEVVKVSAAIAELSDGQKEEVKAQLESGSYQLTVG